MKKVFVLIGIFTMFIVNSFILSAAQTVNLNGTSWELSGIKQNGLNLQIPGNSKITVSFSGNKISGFSGINRYNGTYRIGNKSLSTDISTTLMGGSDELMNFEMAFLDILQSSPKITYSKSMLTLRNRNGDTLTFKRSSNSSNQSDENSLSRLTKELSGTNWKLVNMNGKDVRNIGITISFSGNKINGNSGINSYFSDYIITAGNITIGTVGSTEMAGSDSLMKTERQYIELLQNAKKIELINKTSLVLTTDKRKTLTFEKI